MPPGVLPTANGAHAAKRTASPESEANGIVQQPVMDTISRASTPPEDVPPPPIPPPLAPLEEGLEVILLPEPPPVRWLRAPCHIKVGLAISTAGVQVRRPGSNEHYLTISTHAAYEGSCKKPLPYCKPKSRGIFGKRSIKQLPELVGVSVHEATVGGVEVGRIWENTDATPNSNNSLIFPNDFPHNVSLVGPLPPTMKLEARAGLTWCERLNVDGVSLKILGDRSQAESFGAGSYYGRPLPVKHGKQRLELSAREVHRSILYRRDGKPPPDAEKFRGAPVLLRDAQGEYTEVIGFECFHFRPANAQHENLRMDSREVFHRIISGQVTTIYGALTATRGFKDKWEIVDV